MVVSEVDAGALSIDAVVREVGIVLWVNGKDVVVCWVW